MPVLRYISTPLYRDIFCWLLLGIEDTHSWRKEVAWPSGQHVSGLGLITFWICFTVALNSNRPAATLVNSPLVYGSGLLGFFTKLCSIWSCSLGPTNLCGINIENKRTKNEEYNEKYRFVRRCSIVNCFCHLLILHLTLHPRPIMLRLCLF